jgi:DNA-binding MarR family transcriptional regulator
MAGVTGGIAGLDRRIPFLLSQLGSYVASEFQNQMSGSGVQPRTYAVLTALAGCDGQSQRQLSARLSIHRNVMVDIIDMLEGEGLVQRKPHPGDRRAFAVTLTQRGRRLLPTLDGAACALEDAVTEELSARERDILRGFLQRMASGAGLIAGVHPGLSAPPVVRASDRR